MTFRFRVEKVWHDKQRRAYHLVGLLEEGSLLSPVTANVMERPGETVRIDSMAPGGSLTKNRLTFIADHTTSEPRLLEGCCLTDA
jgi:hypothetical protein